MRLRKNENARGVVGSFLLLLSALVVRPVASVAQASGPLVRLAGHVPRSVATARLLGRVDPHETIRLAIGLAPRDEAGLTNLIERLYNPADPLYGKHLTPAQYAAEFGPAAADYRSLAAYLQSQGLNVVGTHPSRLLLDVAGPAAAVESAFQLHLLRFQRTDGKLFRAPDLDPAVPAVLAGKLTGVAGLDDLASAHPALTRAPAAAPGARPAASGPGGNLAPADIKTAYGLNSSLDGSGQTLVLYELDDFADSDIQAYEQYFNLPDVPIQRVPVDGGVVASTTSGQIEVTLDMEVAIALAPNITRMLVYEGQNGTTAVTDLYAQIADDDAGAQVSTSWSIDEPDGASQAQIDFPLFQQMATQRQTVYAASGDGDAYGNYSHFPPNGTQSPILCVANPASQPYVTGVGGTDLATGSGGAWKSETTWNDAGLPHPVGSGGGISSLWPIPTWQQGVVSPASLGSNTWRNVPDVSLCSGSPGYSIYVDAGWQGWGGTSAAAPLWAAFTALVNQARAETGSNSPLGFANPALYAIGQGPAGPTCFHDIVTGNNLHYPAVPGYDEATGWGTINGAALLPALASLPPPAVSVAATTPMASNSPVTAGTFTITRSGSTLFALTVSYSVSGTAVPGTDYQSLSGSLSIPAGETSAAVTVTPLAGATATMPVTVTLTLTESAGYTLGSPGSGTVSITEPPPALVVKIVAATPSASNSPVKAGEFIVSRTGSMSAPLTVAYGVSGTAVVGKDYSALSGSVTIPARKASAAVTVTPIAGATAVTPPTVILTLTSNLRYLAGPPSSATVSITEPAPVLVTVVATTATASRKPVKSGEFTVSRTGSTTAALAVSYSVGGTAVAGTDYDSLSGTVVISKGKSSATVTVKPLAASKATGSRTVILSLNASGYPVGSPGTATVTINEGTVP